LKYKNLKLTNHGFTNRGQNLQFLALILFGDEAKFSFSKEAITKNHPKKDGFFARFLILGILKSNFMIIHDETLITKKF